MTTLPTPHAAARWAPRLCAFAPVVAFAALVIGWFDPHGGETPIAAAALAVAFLAAGFGLAGLFLSLLASERVPGFVRPRWSLPCALGGIAGGFLGGLMGDHLSHSPENLFYETIEAEGHLIDSRLLQVIFDKIIERGARYEVARFDIGTTNEQFSYVKLRLSASGPDVLRELIRELVPLGCRMVDQRDARLEPAPTDRCVAPDFYSTTNHRTQVRIAGRWIDVQKQRMDAVVAVEGGVATCRKLRDVKAGDLVVSGVDGIRVNPEFVQRDRHGFAFMSNDISSERRVEVAVAKVADMMRAVRKDGGRIAVVAGPVVIHTGGIDYFCDLVRGGWMDVLLSGNALAVHDVEYALYGTSLGVDLQTGSPVEEGHKNHMRAINAVNLAGSLRAAVEQGVLKSGIMHACVTSGVDFVLAGSIRDDGPLPDTLMDLVEAQERYAQALEGVKMVLMLSTMLHSIGVGNMLPSWVRVVCVDINPAVVTKLADRGSAQTLGIVTDVGLFLHQLASRLGQPHG